MPGHLKALVRARMGKTGESYQQALRHVRAQEERAPEPARSTKRTTLSVADTAFSIAVVRGEESAKPEAERLFEDPYAKYFAAAGEHAKEATQRYLDLPFFRDGVRLRTRFIDDFVKERLAQGLTQVVLLGAGFDARGLRMPEILKHRARVYEVDFPDQLELKRDVLSENGVKLPAHVSYVPFDFATGDYVNGLARALEEEGFARGKGAVFIWEGVIGYIDQKTIDQSLELMASVGGPSSQLVFTFSHYAFEPDKASERVLRAGFTAFTELASDEVWRRYLPGDPPPTAWVVKIGTATV